MPTYKFRCEKCGDEFEKMLGFYDKIPKCKWCGGVVQKLIGNGGGVIYKGSGFYTTDYKNKMKPKKEIDL